MVLLFSPMEKQKTKHVHLMTQRSITRDITFVIVTIVVFVSILSLVINLLIVTRENERQLTQKSNEYLSFLNESLEIPLWSYDIETVKKLGEMMMSNDLVSSIKIHDPAGIINFEDRKEDETELVLKTVNIQYQGNMVGSLELGLTKRLYQKQLKHIIITALYTILILIAVLYAIVMLSARRFIRKPLDEFALKLAAIAKGDYQNYPRATPQVELEGIMGNFNQMASKIQSREESLIDTNRAMRNEIVEREKAETLLRESEQRYRSLHDNIPLGVFRSEPGGTITSLNPAMYSILNIPEDADLQSLSTDNFYISTQDRQRPLNELQKGWSVKGFQCQLKDADGKLLWVSISTNPILDEKGNLQYMDGIMEDITQRKQMEEDKNKLQNQLLQLQKMEAIGTLAGGIAHDFNNILGGIIGYSELALAQLENREPGDEEIPASLDEYLGYIYEAGNRARDLVKQILNFSRQGTSTKVSMNLKSLANECIKLLTAVLPKTITVEAFMEAEKNTLLADPSQIHQVIMNLGTNAYQIMREKGGCLTFKIENVQLSQPRSFSGITIMPGNYVKLSVKDTGTGIPFHLQERIFDPYFTTKAVNEGTGLGLSVSLGIIKSHGGLLELTDTSENGTTFSVFLPVSDERLPESEKEEKLVPIGNKEHVLVVDDEPFFLDVMSQMLKSLSYRVTTFQDSVLALEAIRLEPRVFDLLISDQTMPGMTGVQLAGEAKKINPGLPIILCSGYSETVSKDTATNLGITKFLFKPINQRELANAVRIVLDHRE